MSKKVTIKNQWSKVRPKPLPQFKQVKTVDQVSMQSERYSMHTRVLFVRSA